MRKRIRANFILSVVLALIFGLLAVAPHLHADDPQSLGSHDNSNCVICEARHQQAVLETPMGCLAPELALVSGFSAPQLEEQYAHDASFSCFASRAPPRE